MQEYEYVIIKLEEDSYLLFDPETYKEVGRYSLEEAKKIWMEKVIALMGIRLDKLIEKTNRRRCSDLSFTKDYVLDLIDGGLRH